MTTTKEDLNHEYIPQKTGVLPTRFSVPFHLVAQAPFWMKFPGILIAERLFCGILLVELYV